MELKPIPSHKTYGVTPDGKIYCLRKEQEILPFYDPYDYARVYLTNKDGTKAYSVHRLVAETYISNVDNKPEVDHIDRNPRNNHYTNLRWADDYDQCANKKGWGKLGHKCIYREKVNNYECWTVQIKGKDKQFKKRLDTRKFTLQDAIQVRNEYFKTNNMAIID